MTPEQKQLARHALGLPNSSQRSYRNHFVTGEGTTDYPHWLAMVEAGEAIHLRGNPLTGGDPCFYLTLSGATAALEKGERLEPGAFREQLQ